MNNMRNKILSLLVLLMTAATGAWAQGYEVTFSGFADDNLNTTVQVESLPQSFTQINGYELESSALEVVGDNSDHYALVQVTESCNGMVGVSISPTTIIVRGAFEGTAAILFRGVDGNYNAHNRTVYLTCVEKPAVEVNTNAETEGATFTEATFAMPAFDATAEYELVRDMAVGFSFKVGSEGQDGFTIRVKKDGESYVPSEMTMQEMIALITATDNLDAENPVTLTNKVDYTVEIFAADADGKPTGEAVAFNQLVPGTTYVAVATGIGAYDGTALSNTFLMTEAYDLTLSPATDANLKSVTVGEGTEAKTATPDEKGVIKNIEPGKKVKITTTGPDYIIRKATVKGPAQPTTLTINGAFTATIYYIPGETWKQAIDNHPTENAGWVIKGTVVGYQDTKHWVYGAAPDKVIDPNTNYTAYYDPYDD